MPPTPDSLGRVAHPQTARLWNLHERCHEHLRQHKAEIQARRRTEEGVDLTKEVVDELALGEINVDELMKDFAPFNEVAESTSTSSSLDPISQPSCTVNASPMSETSVSDTGASMVDTNSGRSSEGERSRRDEVQLQGDSTISPSPTISVSSTGSEPPTQSNLKRLSLSVSHSHSSSHSVSSHSGMNNSHERNVSSNSNISETPTTSNPSPSPSHDTKLPPIPRSKPSFVKPKRPAPLTITPVSTGFGIESSSCTNSDTKSTAAVLHEQQVPSHIPPTPKSPPPSRATTAEHKDPHPVKPHPPSQPPPPGASPATGEAPPSPKNGKSDSKHARIPSDMTSGGLPKSLARRYGVFVKHCEKAMLEDFCEMRSDSDYLKGLFLHPKKREALRSRRFNFHKVCIRKSCVRGSSNFCCWTKRS